MPANLRRQTFQFRLGDIGRVGDDNVEQAFRHCGVIAGKPARPIGDAVPVRIFPRRCNRVRRQVDADAERLRQFAHQSNQDGTGTRTQIANPPAPVSRRTGKFCKHGFHKRFGIVRIDYDTLARMPKDSAAWYHDLVRTRALPPRPALD